MSRTVYVGNLPNFATEPALAARFAVYGKVISVKLVTDRANGRSLGSAYVVMATDEDAVHMIGQLHGEQYDGRQLTVTPATESGREFGRYRPAAGWKRNPADAESQSVPSRFRRSSRLE